MMPHLNNTLFDCPIIANPRPLCAACHPSIPHPAVEKHDTQQVAPPPIHYRMQARVQPRAKDAGAKTAQGITTSESAAAGMNKIPSGAIPFNRAIATPFN